MNALISHTYFGPTLATSYVTPGLSQEVAYRLIGINTLAGFEPVVYTRTPAGDQLRTRDGNPVTVVALTGSSLRGVIEIEQV
ncbi:hypothetical protein AB0N62_37440 [Streptomyces sp. NPDC093982]|uniref:hypothetical protein n=1 Tax=Streptomyces sp. NPDC093982 TaxID=3155077 RepID=UPI00341E0941